MKAIQFACCDCGQSVSISYMVFNEKKEVRLVGHCSECNQNLTYLLDYAVARLFDKNFSLEARGEKLN